MMSNIQEGQVIEGKVTGIKPYGAFVEIDDQTQGLVHISEVTHGFVKDINEHLSVGDKVSVKVLNVDEENNKYSLSMRATQDKPQAQTQKHQAPVAQATEEDSGGFNVLKDKLEEWIEQSKEREKTFRR